MLVYIMLNLVTKVFILRHVHDDLLIFQLNLGDLIEICSNVVHIFAQLVLLHICLFQHLMQSFDFLIQQFQVVFGDNDIYSYTLVPLLSILDSTILDTTSPFLCFSLCSLSSGFVLK